MLPASPWLRKSLEELHATPDGGSCGAFRTNQLLVVNVYWSGMVRDVNKFVAECEGCQQNKHEKKSPAGLLSPLPIPNRVWEGISIALIIGLRGLGEWIVFL